MTPDWTRFPELNHVLATLVDDVSTILGDCMIGAYLQGSFALHEGDETSDSDFLIVLRSDPTAQQLGELMVLHDEIPLRDGHWSKHLEGSYPIAEQLRGLSARDQEWWFVDHGSRLMTRSTHCNHAFVRWLTREHGITLAGPPPADLIDAVPPEAVRAEMRAMLPNVLPDLMSWAATLEVAWIQRILVATTRRVLFTLDTAEVTSKRLALEWAIQRLEPEWEPLLSQVLVDRPLGLDVNEPPRPGSLEQSLAFLEHAHDVAANW
ncbi:MAG: aminoglycoside adenylyltransferase domain-containing protein [Humibacillus sp.]